MEVEFREITESHLMRESPVMISHHAVGEILLLGVAAHVLERQNRDRRLFRPWSIEPSEAPPALQDIKLHRLDFRLLQTR